MQIESREDYILVPLKVIPKSSRQQIVGVVQDRLKVKISSAPEAGKANKEVIALFADLLHISRGQIHIQLGETSPLKMLKIEGISKEVFLQKTGLG